MILSRFEPGESDVVVEYNSLTSTFTVTLPFSIFIKYEGMFINEFSTQFPTAMIGFLWELERDGFLVPPDIIETLRQISHRRAGTNADRFRPRARPRPEHLKLVA